MKAVFLDYSGTLLQNSGEDLNKAVQRIVTNSRIPDDKTLKTWWLENLRKYEAEAVGDSFLTEEEICGKILRRLEQEWGLKENFYEVQQLYMNHWMQGPLFSDVNDFFMDCTVPIYIITNLSSRYVRICLKRHNLHVHGIVDAEQVKAYKPHEDIYRKALEIAEVDSKDVLYIGDALESEVLPAMEMGMNAVLLDRTRSVGEAPCRIVRKLSETLRYL